MQVDFNTGSSRDFSQFLKKDTQKDTTNRSSPILIRVLRLPPAPLLIGKTLLNQRFLFLSLVFLGILLRKKDTTKDTTFLSYPRNLCTSQSVLRCRPLLASLCGYKRSWSFLSQSVRDDVGLVSKSCRRQNINWHVYA